MNLSHKDTTEYTTIKINLKTHNTILKRNIMQAKILYYQHLFDQYKYNIKNIKERVNRASMKQKYNIAWILHCWQTSTHRQARD